MNTKSLRKKLGMSQTQFAKHIGYSLRQVQRFESGASIRPIIAKAILAVCCNA